MQRDLAGKWFDSESGDSATWHCCDSVKGHPKSKEYRSMKTRTRKSKESRRRKSGKRKLGHVTENGNGRLDGEFGHVRISDEIDMGEVKHRPRITDAKRPFLDAVLHILREYESSWPLSVRQVHYYLLNDPPLIHASKPESRYRNTMQGYKAADELIIRARLTREI